MSISHSEGGILSKLLLHTEIVKEKIHIISICHMSTIMQFSKKDQQMIHYTALAMMKLSFSSKYNIKLHHAWAGRIYYL